MKFALYFLAVSGSFCASAVGTPLIPPTAYVKDDLFDVSTGVVVTGHSPLSTIPPRNVISDLFGGGEPGNPDHNYGIHFGDESGTGFQHFVEFSTPEPRTIYSIGLAGAHDLGRGWFGRGFSTFELWGDGVLVYTFDTANPYSAMVPPPESAIVHNTDAWIEMVANLPQPATASEWKAIFVQPGDLYRGHANGPRLSELNGFGFRVVVPEPGTWCVLAWALWFAAFRRFTRCVVHHPD